MKPSSAQQLHPYPVPYHGGSTLESMAEEELIGNDQQSSAYHHQYQEDNNLDRPHHQQTSNHHPQHRTRGFFLINVLSKIARSVNFTAVSGLLDIVHGRGTCGMVRKIDGCQVTQCLLVDG